MSVLIDFLNNCFAQGLETAGRPFDFNGQTGLTGFIQELEEAVIMEEAGYKHSISLIVVVAISQLNTEPPDNASFVYNGKSYILRVVTNDGSSYKLNFTLVS